MKKITEAIDVNLYKSLLIIFGDYTKSFPCTGVDQLFDALINGGKKMLPTDVRAQLILINMIQCYSTSEVVQRLLNMRFSDLSNEIKPVQSDGMAAYWSRGSVVSDKIKSLIDLDNTKTTGYWSDSNGTKITLV